MMKFKSYIILSIAALGMSSCAKEWLDKKRNSKEVIPTTIADYQATLDNYTIINTFSTVSLGLVGAAEYTLADATLTTWKNTIPYEANGYLWEKEVYEGKELPDWNNSYHRLLYANLALEVKKINPTNPTEQTAWNNVVGSALFIRSFCFYQLAQLFCKPYDAATAASDPGIPLRTDPDIKVSYQRGTVADVYKRMIEDLEAALPLLPEKPLNVWRPGKPAAAALLARIYMQMGNWEKVKEYSDMGLKIKSDLINFAPIYNQASFKSDNGASNPEILFYSQINKPGSTYTGMTADTVLLKLYDTADARRAVYFSLPANSAFKGSYAGLYNIFTGLTTGEMYLQRAEANARLGQAGAAMDDVNQLRKFRFADSMYVPETIADPKEALKFVLDERRRELYFRGVRWEDLRRLNKEPEFATTLKRNAYGKTYELKPGENRWTWALPDNEISINNYPQNPR